MQSAGLPVHLIGSPVNFTDCFIGSPITWHYTAARGPCAPADCLALRCAADVFLAEHIVKFNRIVADLSAPIEALPAAVAAAPRPQALPAY